jgi:uncharacterized damage-inducible protein DinB
MKEYLIDTFKFNDRSNKTVLGKIKEMAEPEEAIKLFSHLIDSQNKWMARINNDPEETKMEWFGKSLNVNELENEWNKSIEIWLNFMEKMNEDDLMKVLRYKASDGTRLGAKIKDIALQLNYHSIHHRAQICMLLRNQKIEPPFIEYIGSVVTRY